MSKMENTIKTLALIKVTLDHHPNIKDYLDIFIPFLVTLIKKKEITDLKNIQYLRNEFQTEYGLMIPHHPMLALVNRLIVLGYGREIGPGEFSPVFDKINTDNFINEATKHEKKYDALINSFVTFSNEKHGLKISLDEASRNLLLLLEVHDIDIVFADDKGDSILPVIDKSEIGVNLAYDFVRSSYEQGLPEFEVMADIAFGHIIANSVIIGTNLSKEVNLSKVNYYLDTGILFGLFGINGDYEKKVYAEFVRLLKNHNGNAYIFNHTYDEFINIVDACRNWIDNPSYDINKANRTLVRFRSLGYHSSDIDIFISKIPKTLTAYGIVVVDTPNPNVDNEHQMGDIDFQRTLIEIYKKNYEFFDEDQKEGTIYLDVRSVSAIFKLRKGNYPRNLGECGYVFVTRNSTLAYASKLFEKSISKIDRFYIPTTVTDGFIGTIIWLSSPVRCDMQNISKTRLIASCYAALHPSRQLKKLFLVEVEKAEKDNLISSDEVIVLKTANIAEEMLQERTLGNPNKITTQTPIEIINEIKVRAKNEARKEFNEIRKSLEIEKLEKEQALEIKDKELELKSKEFKDKENALQIELDNKQKIINNITKSITKRASRQSWFLLSILICIFILINIITVVDLPFYVNRTFLQIGKIISAIVSIASVLFNIDLLKTRSKYINWRIEKELRSLGISTNKEDNDL